jgi:uncharacterized cysteine cluster protein YcgN (CxxCxxCC family)
VNEPFWKTRSLAEMSTEEWESVCDGCARCCLFQLEDEDSGELVFTDVACRLLDQQACRCTRYETRKKHVPGCMVMNPENVAECAEFAPPTCAYRLLVEGRDLPDWHPLVSGDPGSVHAAGISVRGRVISETELGDRDLEERVVVWPLFDTAAKDTAE